MYDLFLYPEFFLLAIPAGFVYWKWGRADGVTGWIRIALLITIILALTCPQVNLGGEGVDVVAVVDRSKSLPAEAEGRIRELIKNLENSRRRGDRLGIVTFGSTPAVEQVLAREGTFESYKKVILQDGSDLNAALDEALTLLSDPRRPGRVLVLSDGEANGPSPTAAARRAKELGIPIDYREFPRQRTNDVAIESLDLPDRVTPLEPFQYSVWIASDGESEGRVRIFRNGRPVVQDKEPRTFRPGLTRLLFRDILDVPGLNQFEVRVESPGDPLTENNFGAGIVRVEAAPRMLVLNNDGQPDNFTRAVEGGRIPVDVKAAATFPLTPESLDPYRAVVVENVPASALGRVRMERLAEFVEELGGGLLLTGGERSFGNGGYFKSPLDETLPVSMEMRDEHRKTRLAMAIALDRSGSMAVPVKGNRVKMDLANLGTAECVRVLTAGDSVAVIAVDSAPHVVQSLTNVDDPEPIVKKALGIQSMGGGIFVYEALVAAGRELMHAEQSTKHIILFSDAADSEEPGDYKKLLAQYEAAGITVSVIGLGTDKDVDAELLKDVAKLGRGNIMFTEDAEELPRLFTQDTMSVARSSFIKKDGQTQPAGISGHSLPSARLISDFPAGAFPSVDGYNLSYLKPGATLGVVSDDEYAAPWAAYWYRGLGRVAAVTVEVDGPNTGAFGQWSDYGDFAVTTGRWLLGGTDVETAYLTLSREGQEAVVQLELDPERPLKSSAEAPTLVVLPPGDEREEPRRIPLQWRGPQTLQASFRLDRTGTFRSLVVLDGKSIVRAPAVTLPYSPEHMPRIGLPSGGETLKQLAELSGGKARVDVVEVVHDRPRAAGTMSLLPYLCVLAVGLLLVEIAGRRLALWEKVADALVGVPEMIPVRRPANRPVDATATKPVATPAATARPPETRTEPAAPPAIDVFEQAKRRARRRNE